MSRVIFAVVVACFVSTPAWAQVFYEPVTYQYDSGGRSYYYGGASADVHRAANAQSQFPWWGRSGGYAFHSGRIDTHREVSTEPTRIYTDAVPYWNARFFGYTVDDARNEAYANAPRYFRKSEVMRSAIRMPDGSAVVPAQPVSRGTIDIRPWKPAEKAATVQQKPKTEPQPILIIPKRLLDQPLWPREQNLEG